MVLEDRDDSPSNPAVWLDAHATSHQDAIVTKLVPTASQYGSAQSFWSNLIITSMFTGAVLVDSSSWPGAVAASPFT